MVLAAPSALLGGVVARANAEIVIMLLMPTLA